MSFELPKFNAVTPVLRVDGNANITCTSCSPRIWWVDSHWDGRRTVPHFKDAKMCPGCSPKCNWPLRPKGFLLVQEAETRQANFLEVTPEAGKNLVLQLEPGKDLFGRILYASRVRKSIRSPLAIKLGGKCDHPTQLFRDKSPLPTLMRLWGCEHLQEEVEGKKSKN